ncbi:putative ribonuclease H protein [Glycine soja]
MGYVCLSFCGLSSSVNAELHAIFHGLRCEWIKGLRNIICKSDSKLALQFVTEGVIQSHPYAPIVAKIREFLSYDGNLSFLHTLREGNLVSDYLAKK